jgi:hypothetical protein
LQETTSESWHLSPDDERSEWEWGNPPPKIWRPSCTFDFDGVTVAFLTRSELGENAISMHVDRYGRGSTRFESEVTTIATGGGGFVW